MTVTHSLSLKKCKKKILYWLSFSFCSICLFPRKTLIERLIARDRSVCFVFLRMFDQSKRARCVIFNSNCLLEHLLISGIIWIYPISSACTPAPSQDPIQIIRLWRGGRILGISLGNFHLSPWQLSPILSRGLHPIWGSLADHSLDSELSVLKFSGATLLRL